MKKWTAGIFWGHNKEKDKSSMSCLDKHKQSWNGCVLVAQQCPMCYASLGQFSLRAALIRLFRLAARQTHRAHSLSQMYPCFIFLLYLCKEREMGWSECRSWARWKAECTRWLASDTSRTLSRRKCNHERYKVKIRVPLRSKGRVWHGEAKTPQCGKMSHGFGKTNRVYRQHHH